MDLQKCKYFGSQQLQDVCLREGWVGSASRFWGESWMQLVTVPWTKADSSQGMLLLSFDLLSDQTSRVTFLPPTPPPKWLRIVSWEKSTQVGI